MPKKIFDAQLSFNLLARYGEEAPVSARSNGTAHRAAPGHAALRAPGAGEGAPMPSLRLIQAPVFHGYSFSLWVEFEENPGVDALEGGAGTAHIDVRGAEFEPPTTAGMAGQSGIAVGAIAPDRNDAAGLLVLAGGGQSAPGGGERRGGGDAILMRRRLPDIVWTAAIAGLLASAGCGYHVAGKADVMPQTVQTIAIPPFANRTIRYKLARDLPADDHARIHLRARATRS